MPGEWQRKQIKMMSSNICVMPATTTTTTTTAYSSATPWGIFSSAVCCCCCYCCPSTSHFAWPAVVYCYCKKFHFFLLLQCPLLLLLPLCGKLRHKLWPSCEKFGKRRRIQGWLSRVESSGHRGNTRCRQEPPFTRPVCCCCPSPSPGT